MKTNRSLYDCQLARYPVPPEEYCYCKANHDLGHIHKRRVDKSKPLRLAVCQECRDFISMGEPWVKGTR